MESKIATGTNDSLLDALDFRLPDVANYIVDRTSCTFFPQGGQPYAPGGVRLIRFVLADNSQFIDPTTIRLCFDLANTTAPDVDPAKPNALELLGPPICLFMRGRLLVNGTLVEDINYLGRTMMMFKKCMPALRGIENALEADWEMPIPAGKSHTFMMQIPFGMFSQSLNLWLKVAPITIELELCQDMSYPIQAPTNTVLARSWQLENAQLKCDAVYCTSEFTDQYSQMLLENTPLPVPFSTYAVQMQTIAGTASAFSVNINRAFTRLRSIWFTFMGPPKVQTLESQMEIKTSLINTYRQPPIDIVNQKEVNLFHHPMQGNKDLDFDTMEYQIQIGSRTYPQYPIRSVAEAAYHLHKTLGMTMSGTTSIGATEYRNTSFIAAISLERAVNGAGEGASFSGESTIGGEMITLNIKNMPLLPAVPLAGGGNAIPTPTAIYITCFYDSIMNIRSEGVEVLL
jgi:hypothetical protein